MRSILAAIAGIVVAGAVVGLVEAAGHFIYPPPQDMELSKPDAVMALIDKMPLGALLFVVAAWTLGAFAGSAAATRLTRPASVWPGLAVGAAILAATIYILTIIPHPTWMMVAGMALPLPSAWLGARILR